MSGSARKRKSLWDRIGEPQLPAEISEKDSWREKESYSNLHVGHGPKWSDLEDDNAFRTKDFSGRPAWELSKGSGNQKDDRRDLDDFPETRKPWDGDKSYHGSSAFDRLQPQNRSHSPENSRNVSSRYRRSSRSMSRSRDRGRGRSRSPSRGRGRSRDRDWDRGRDRGRSRSRSRSPLGNYRQESYRWTDRSRNGLSQPCRDFASGNCRRGSECKFLHQDNLNHKDGGRFESEKSERWRSTQERGGNGYDGGKDEPRRSSGKSTVLCNDFMRGRCSRGSSCRFSHDDDATGYNSERSKRDSSFDHEYKRQPRTNGNTPSKFGNTPCKFFMMGNCNRDNCRFSHDGAGRDFFEGKSQDDGRGKVCDDTNKSWNGPKWGEGTAVSDVLQSVGWSNARKEAFAVTNDVDEMSKPWNGLKWGEPTVVSDFSQSTGWGNVGKETFIDPAPAEKRTDDRRYHSFEDENKKWSGPKWGDATGVSEIERSTGWGNSSGDNMNLADPANAEKHTDALHGLQSKTPYRISKDVREQNIGQEASGRPHPTTFTHSAFPEDSIIQQHHNPLGDNNAVTDDFNSHGVDVYAIAPDPAFVSGQNNNREADSFPSAGGLNQSQHMVSVNPSNGLDIDLNGPVQQNYSPSNLQNKSQSQHGESVQKIVNSTIPLNIVNNEQGGQVSNFPSSLMQIIGNGQLPQLYAALNPPNSTESVPSLPQDTRPDPASVSQTQYNLRADSIEPTKNDSKQNSEILLKYSSPQPAVGFDAVEPHKNEFMEDNSHRSPQLRQQKPVADSVSVAEKQKQDLENTHPGNVDANPRIVDGNTEKDEKAMRPFRNALVEFVKEILKPKWKQGQMSREVHKNIVGKVVDKVTSTIQGANIPKTQDKIDQYLMCSKPKLTKLVEAYTERFCKGP